MRRLRVGSRGSELALGQTRWAIARLRELVPGLQVDIEIIRTRGDVVTDVPLSRVGDRGLFIKEIETALLEERIDFAVHSMKDVPSQIPGGLVLAATTERLDPRDVLIARGARRLTELRPGAVIATGSLRRRSQALALRPDLLVEDLRGNVTTRLEKFDASTWDAVILASAGLERLGLSHRAMARIPTEEMLPAAGQGALALEARTDDLEVIEKLGQLQHQQTAAAVRAERAFLRRLEGGCQVPVASLGSVEEDRVTLQGYVGTIDGKRFLRRTAVSPISETEGLGERLAERILAEGGRDILEQTRHLSAS